jgi:hypothetical protein
MAGLYTKKNLSEKQLNLTDALQKLYFPGIQEDIRLFAFSNALFSEIRSASVETDSETGEQFISDNEIVGFQNLPFTNQSGETVLRTKFVTNNFAFSSDNKVFFQKIDPSFVIDKRSNLDPGAPIIVSRNGGVIRVSVVGAGSNYQVRNSDNVPQIPTGNNVIGVDVNLRGVTSGSENCLVTVFVTANGSLSIENEPIVKDPGSGYIEGEALEIIRQCGTTRYGEAETEKRHKCKKYSSLSNSLYQILYDDSNQITSKRVAVKASLIQDKYYYITKDSDNEGFFLFDEKTNKWVYLGSFYNTTQNIPVSESPVLTLRRFDQITSENLLKLKSLDSTAYIENYEQGFSVSDSLGSEIRSLSNSVDNIRDGFKYFLQNNKNHKLETDRDNTLKIRYNTFEGRNFDSNFRIILRDPDNVLDDYPEVSFLRLQLLQETGRGDNSEVFVNNILKYRAPGLYMNVGGLYIRAFSTDDKPFLGKKNRFFISPRLHQPNNSGGFEDATDYKYSLSASHFPAGVNNIFGFSTEIGVLSQNLSGNPNNGGFVFYRGEPLTTPTINFNESVIGLPLFDYRLDKNSVNWHSPNILAILDTTS